MNSLCTDLVIMKPRCVSSSSLDSIAQMRVHDIAVLFTMWQVVGASYRSNSYAKISYRLTRIPNMPVIIEYSWHIKNATM